MKHLSEIINEGMKSNFYKEDKDKAEEITIKLEGEIGTSPHSRQAIEESLLEMAEWKDEQFHDWFINVGFIKVLHFINEKQKSENETIDTMKWDKLQKEFEVYLKKQK